MHRVGYLVSTLVQSERQREFFLFQGVIKMPADYDRVKEELKILHVGGAFYNSKGYATLKTNAFTCTGKLISP